ncbi:MAG: phosphoribosylamine--glycine ligase [Chitinophagaceae bacterium]|nr:phosphoribosylamine--glycine ligase [Chitinophagaceae bacterium]
MKILIIGGGGREHAIAWKLKQSAEQVQLFIAPGNAGTSQLGTNVDLDLNDFTTVKAFCLQESIDMVVVGPEDALVRGIYDYFKKDSELQHIVITGPSAEGAQLEGSKSFAKAFMQRHNIPTAAYREFDATNFDEGVAYLQQHSLPIVLKADGLAAGKGVLICASHEEAISEFSQMIREAKFGASSKKVVVEQFLDGIELSVFICTDGEHYVLLPEAKDYKKIGVGDTGLNTGGMGAVSPVPFATPHFMQKIITRIVNPTVKGLKEEGIDYKGFIFFGLIKVNDEPYVIEYNCRLGDPETEVILLRFKNDLVEVLKAMHEGTLDKIESEISPNAAVTVMAVSGGYPGSYKKGFPIAFNYLNNPMEIKHMDRDGGVVVFHAGTKQADGSVVTSGGRVLSVSSMAPGIAESLELSMEVIEQIHFEGMYYRDDIGNEFVD